MKPEIGLRLGLASVIAGFGLTKLVAQLFLASWATESLGHPDIAVRGEFLLGGLLTQLFGIAVVLTVVAIGLATRRSRAPLLSRLSVACLGGILGGLVILGGLDPTLGILRRLPGTALRYYWTSAAVAAAVSVLGIVLARSMNDHVGTAA